MALFFSKMNKIFNFRQFVSVLHGLFFVIHGYHTYAASLNKCPWSDSEIAVDVNVDGTVPTMAVPYKISDV